MAFSLSIYPWVFKAQFAGNGSWTEVYDEKPHKTPAEEAALSLDIAESAEHLVAQIEQHLNLDHA
jgi:branched-chain amino acid aminotransferase